MVVLTVNTTMAYNRDDEEMVPDGLVEVALLIQATLDGLIAVTFHAQAIVEFHVPRIYVSAPGWR